MIHPGYFEINKERGHHHGMNTSELECCIDCDMLLKQYVVGVFPIDRLPRDCAKYPCGFDREHGYTFQAGDSLDFVVC